MAGSDKYQKLFDLCVKGDRIALADYIISSGCNPSAYDAHDSLGKTALHFACQHGHIFVVKSLVEVFGCNPGLKDIGGNQPIHDACLYGHLEIVCYLCDLIDLSEENNLANAVFMTDSISNNLLHKACQSGSVPLVRYLYQALCYPRGQMIRKSNLYLDNTTSYDLAASEKLSSACRQRKMLIECLLKKNEIGDTPLQVACRHGHLNVLRVFQMYVPYVDVHVQGLNFARVSVECNHIPTATYILKQFHPRFSDFDSESIFTQSEEFIGVDENIIKCVKCKNQFHFTNVFQYNRKEMTGICPKCSTLPYIVYKFRCVECEETHKRISLVNAVCVSCESPYVGLIAPTTHVDDFEKLKYSHSFRFPPSAALRCGNVSGFKQIQQYVHDDDKLLLHDACISDNVALIKYVMETVSNELNAADEDGLTPLHIACIWGSENAVSHLLSLLDDSQVCVPDKFGRPPFFYACSLNRPNIYKRLPIKTSLNVSADDDKETLLHIACSNKDVKLAKLIFDNGGCSFVNSVDMYGDTPIFNACRCCDLEMVQYLIWNGADPFFVNEKTKESLMHLVCRMGHLDILKTLLELPTCANHMNCKNINGATPIQLAIERDCLPAITMLIKSGFININDNVNRNKATLAHFAAVTGQNDLAKLLMEHSVNWDAQDCDGNTALHVACLSEHTEFVGLIVGKSSVTVQNVKNQTPIHIACASHNVCMLQSLLTGFSGSLDSYVDLEGNTVVHAACENVTSSTLDILTMISKHCCVAIQNDLNKTPLHMACEYTDISVVRKLLDKLPQDCPLESLIDVEGNSVLHIAVQNGSVEITKLLLNHISPMGQNEKGETAIHLACEKGNISVIQAIFEKCQSIKNVLSKVGISYLHAACNRDQTEESLKIVKFLLEESGLVHDELLAQDEEGNSPLHYACIKGSLETFMCLLSFVQSDNQSVNKQGLTPFCYLLKGQHLEEAKAIVKSAHTDQLSSQNWPVFHSIWTFTLNTSDPKTKVDLFKVAVSNQCFDVSCCDLNGDSILHCFLKQLWSFPLHNETCLDALVTFWEYLLNLPGITINQPNKKGDTPMHLLVSSNIFQFQYLLPLSKSYDYLSFGEQLLLKLSKEDIKASFSIKNCNEKTPVQCAGMNAMRSLIKYGADPQEVEALWSVIEQFKNQHPLDSSVKIIVVGNSEAGKTTLVKALQALDSSRDTFIKVTDRTCAMETVEYRSDRYGGRVTFHDFGGQPEFESGNSAFLNSLTCVQPPIFLLTVDISKPSSSVERTAQYWLTYLHDHTPQQLKMQLIIVGSHKDCTKNPKLTQLVATLKSDKFDITGTILMDCRKPHSEDMNKLSSLLSNCCSNLRKTVRMTINGQCHVLMAHLSSWFKDETAVKFLEVQRAIEQKSGNIHSYNDVIPLPTETDSLMDLLQSLHSGGHVVLLKPQFKEDCWVVLDHALLFKTINGTLFAPEVFRSPPCDPVLTEQKLISLFCDEKIDLITAFSVYYEFCQKIEDHETLALIEQSFSSHGSSMQSETQDHSLRRWYFFPGLVKCGRPQHVWSDSNSDSHNDFGWCLICNRGNFFYRRFLSVLLLRLMFTFPAKTNKLHPKCNIWKNGIYWSTTKGVQILVEVIEQNTAVLLLTRFTKDYEMDGVKLRSKVIKKVLETKEKYSSNVEVTEYILRLTEMPQALESEIKFPLSTIAQVVCAAEPCVVDSRCKPHLLKTLLYFDAYLEMGEDLIKQLTSEENSKAEVTPEFLFELAQKLHTSVPQVTKMLAIPQSEPRTDKKPIKLLFHLLESWKARQEGTATFMKLRDLFDSYSIFCGRSPLDLASEEPMESTHEPADSNFLPTFTLKVSNYPEKDVAQVLALEEPMEGTCEQALTFALESSNNPEKDVDQPKDEPMAISSTTKCTVDGQTTNTSECSDLTMQLSSQPNESSHHTHGTMPDVAGTHSPIVSRGLTLEELKKHQKLTDDILDRLLDPEDIVHVSKFFGTVEEYAVCLGLTRSQLTDVKNSQTTAAGMAKALNLWRDKNPIEATFRTLIEITLKCGQGMVAKDIGTYLSDLYLNPPSQKRIKTSAASTYLH